MARAGRRRGFLPASRAHAVIASVLAAPCSACRPPSRTGSACAPASQTAPPRAASAGNEGWAAWEAEDAPLLGPGLLQVGALLSRGPAPAAPAVGLAVEGGAAAASLAQLASAPLLPGPAWLERPLDTIADVLAAVVFLAPLPEILLCIRSRWATPRPGSSDSHPATLKMPPLYLTAGCMNTYYWILFGIQTHQSTVVYPGLVGIAAAVFYTVAYPLLVDKRSWDPETHGDCFEGVSKSSALPSPGLRHEDSSILREAVESKEVQSGSTTETGTSVKMSGEGRQGTLELPTRNVPFRRNFRLQYYLQLLLIAMVWAAPWVFNFSTSAIGWIAVFFDSIFLSAPVFVLYEVVWMDWRNKENVVLLGNWAMNLTAFLASFSWVLLYLMYIPLVQILPSNALGVVFEGVALWVRVCKWMM